VNDARREVVRRGYDEIADRYLAARATGGDLALLPELVARLSAGDAVLDAGCGAGDPVMTQLVDADLEVVGIDLSSAQLRLARSHSPGARVAQADLVALPFGDGSFDGLVSYYAVIHVPRSEHRRRDQPGDAAGCRVRHPSTRARQRPDEPRASSVRTRGVTLTGKNMETG
jgi:ubiquinone/menaquinone biosynthesis C-methylase UbiE